MAAPALCGGIFCDEAYYRPAGAPTCGASVAGSARVDMSSVSSFCVVGCFAIILRILSGEVGGGRSAAPGTAWTNSSDHGPERIMRPLSVSSIYLPRTRGPLVGWSAQPTWLTEGCLRPEGLGSRTHNQCLPFWERSAGLGAPRSRFRREVGARPFPCAYCALSGRFDG
jgi:hypothetical protein